MILECSTLQDAQIKGLEMKVEPGGGDEGGGG